MFVSMLKFIFQMFFILLISPLFTGVIRKIKSKIQHKIGASVFQPYYDLIKLLKKIWWYQIPHLGFIMWHHMFIL